MIRIQRSLASRAVALTSALFACGSDEIPLQVVQGQVDLAALDETSLLVQARDEQEVLQSASTTDASGSYILFVPPSILTITASGRRLHTLGSLVVCAVGPPVSIPGDAPPAQSEACLSARADLSSCRQTVEPACSRYETEVFACRNGQSIEECAAQEASLNRCRQAGGMCSMEEEALEGCVQSACEERLYRFLDGGCLDGCGPQEEAVLAACSEPRTEPQPMEVGCSSS